MNRRLWIPFVLFVGLTMMGASSAEAQLGLRIDGEPGVAGEPLVAGEPVVVLVTTAQGQPMAKASVTVELRPSSQLSETLDLGRTHTDGVVRFVPERAGLLRLRAEDPATGATSEPLDVAVHFPHSPLGAWVMLSLACGLLLAGAFLGLSSPKPRP